MAAMSKPANAVLYGFHAVTVRLKTHPESVSEVHIDPSRRDARMHSFVERVREAGARLIETPRRAPDPAGRWPAPPGRGSPRAGAGAQAFARRCARRVKGPPWSSYSTA